MSDGRFAVKSGERPDVKSGKKAQTDRLDRGKPLL
jgi:hypothetical protein